MLVTAEGQHVRDTGTAVDERDLVEGLRAQAEWARRDFYVRAHDAVFARACRLTKDVDLRRDWTHECLLRLAEDVANGRFVYQRPGSLWAWFRARAPFLLLDSLRRRRRLEAREVQDFADDIPDIPDPDDPAHDLESLETLHAIDTCLANLANDDQRRALELLLYEEMSYEEIAAALNRPLNTVRTDIRRGRLVLRECLIWRLELTP
jgi:RNA polymerase sigma-70 factor, ECF subfamily